MNKKDNYYYFPETGYVPKRYHLSQEQYGAALDNLVVACVDVAIVYRGDVLLLKRAYNPQKDWWILGGRIFTGESPKEAAVRHVSKDLNINIVAHRFTYLFHFYANWKIRRHEPETNGTHTHSSVFMAELAESEYNSITLGNEYINSKLVKVDSLTDDNYHPMFKELHSALNN